MKLIYLILVFCFFFGASASAQLYVGQTHNLPFEDTGKTILSMRSTRYKATWVDGKAVPGEKTDEVEFFYDKHGKLIKRIILSPVKNGKYTPQYAGFIMQHAFDDSVSSYNKLTYDKQGNLTAMQHDPLIYNKRGEFKYNKQNQLIEVRQYGNYQQSLLEVIQTSQYNKDGKLTERDLSDGGGKLLSKEVLTYDTTGRLTEEISTNDKGDAHKKYTYNSSGKLTQQLIISTTGKENTYDYEYDEKGRPSKTYHIQKGVKKLYSFFKYDTVGNGYQYTVYNGNRKIVQTITKSLKKRESFDGDTRRDTQGWQYDKYGNVIEHMEGYLNPSQGDTPTNVSVIINDITYRKDVPLKEKPYPDRFRDPVN